MNNRDSFLLSLVLVMFGTTGSIVGSLFLVGLTITYLTFVYQVSLRWGIKELGEHGEISKLRRDKKSHFEIWEGLGVYRSSWICPDCDHPMEVAGYHSKDKVYFGSFFGVSNHDPESFVELAKFQNSLAIKPSCGYCFQPADVSDKIVISGRPRAIMTPDHKLVIEKEDSDEPRQRDGQD